MAISKEFVIELRKEFLSDMDETQDRIRTLSKSILGDPDTALNEVMRICHNMKGQAQIVGLMSLSKFAHDVEGIIEKIIEKKIPPVDILLLEDTMKGLNKELGRHLLEIYKDLEGESVYKDPKHYMGTILKEVDFNESDSDVDLEKNDHDISIGQIGESGNESKQAEALNSVVKDFSKVDTNEAYAGASSNIQGLGFFKEDGNAGNEDGIRSFNAVDDEISDVGVFEDHKPQESQITGDTGKKSQDSPMGFNLEEDTKGKGLESQETLSDLENSKTSGFHLFDEVETTKPMQQTSLSPDKPIGETQLSNNREGLLAGDEGAQERPVHKEGVLINDRYLRYIKGSTKYLINTSYVRQVLEYRSEKEKPLPYGKEGIRGVIPYRGGILPILSFNNKDDLEKSDKCLIVCSAHKKTFAISIAEAIGIDSIVCENIDNLGYGKGEKNRNGIQGLIKIYGEPYLIFNPEQCLMVV